MNQQQIEKFMPAIPLIVGMFGGSTTGLPPKPLSDAGYCAVGTPPKRAKFTKPRNPRRPRRKR